MRLRKMDAKKNVLTTNIDDRSAHFTIHEEMELKVKKPFEEEAEKGGLYHVYEITYGSNEDDTYNFDLPVEKEILTDYYSFDMEHPGRKTIVGDLEKIGVPESKFEYMEKYENQRKFFFLLFILLAIIMDVQTHLQPPSSEESFWSFISGFFSDPIVSASFAGAIMVLTTTITLTKHDQSCMTYNLTKISMSKAGESEITGVYVPSAYGPIAQQKLFHVKHSKDMLARIAQLLAATTYHGVEIIEELTTKRIELESKIGTQSETFTTDSYGSPEYMDIRKAQELKKYDMTMMAMLLGFIFAIFFTAVYYLT